MITWDAHVRTTKKTLKEFCHIKDKVEKRDPSLLAYYCVTSSTNPSNRYEVLNMGQFWFRHYLESSVDIHILGVAESETAAFGLVKDMILEENKRGL